MSNQVLASKQQAELERLLPKAGSPEAIAVEEANKLLSGVRSIGDAKSRAVVDAQGMVTSDLEVKYNPLNTIGAEYAFLFAYRKTELSKSALALIKAQKALDDLTMWYDSPLSEILHRTVQSLRKVGIDGTRENLAKNLAILNGQCIDKTCYSHNVFAVLKPIVGTMVPEDLAKMIAEAQAALKTQKEAQKAKEQPKPEEVQK